MNLSLFIARRYFFSKKKKNFINVISIISMVVVGIGAMALVIVMSVVNGLEGVLKSLYGGFDPEIQITATAGKSFHFDEDLKEKINSVEGIAFLTEVIEDNALVKYKNAQRKIRLKGVSDNFLEQERLTNIVYGDRMLKKEGIEYALAGQGIPLPIDPRNGFYTLQVFYPRDISPGQTDVSRLFNIKHILPAGLFAVEKYIDENYVIVPLTFARSLMNYGDRRTALEIQVSESSNVQEVKRELIQILGTTYKVLTNDEIHQDLYKVLKMEKLIVFIVLSLIIAISSINIYFSLMMLAIDKRKDIAILSSQGAPDSIIRKVFFFEGIIVAFTGAFTGLILGIAITLAQQEFGFISMGMQTAITQSYPVKIVWFDVLMATITIIVITVLASIQPARLATKHISIQDLS